MPKNTSGGSGHKKRKNNSGPTLKKQKGVDELQKSNITEAHEYYAVVEKPLGGRRFNVQCQRPNQPQELDTLVVKLAGACRATRIVQGTFVLVQRFPFNLNQGGIVQVFSDDDVATLKFAKVWDFPVKKIKGNQFKIEDISFRVEDFSSDEEEEEEEKDNVKHNRNRILDDVDADVI